MNTQLLILISLHRDKNCLPFTQSRVNKARKSLYNIKAHTKCDNNSPSALTYNLKRSLPQSAHRHHSQSHKNIQAHHFHNQKSNK